MTVPTSEFRAFCSVEVGCVSAKHSSGGKILLVGFADKHVFYWMRLRPSFGSQFLIPYFFSPKSMFMFPVVCVSIAATMSSAV